MNTSVLRPHSATRVAVIGGGLIGLGIAWRLAQRRHDVVVFDRDELGLGASYAAAGMLSVVGEAETMSKPLFDLCLESRRRWVDFADELERCSGVAIDFRARGTLLVARNERERAELTTLLERYAPVDLLLSLSAEAALAFEPAAAPDMMSAFAPVDGSVDNRRLLVALRLAAMRAGVTFRTREGVTRIVTCGARAVGVESPYATYPADIVVLASGVGTNSLLAASGLPELAQISPVKGELIALQMNSETPLIRRVIRSLDGTYIVPRSTGRVIVGATSVPGDWSLSTSPEAKLKLQRGAIAMIPALADLPVIDHWAGLRPLSASGLPHIGPAGPTGLILALGHYRNGVLLTPITADLIAAMLMQNLSQHDQALVSAFNPGNDDLPAGNREAWL